ncbi:hypothetical protein K492DRAFT_209750 [Lichtheimia hyalospora FSU 10163]|nr:hypothetical protein K492DRAFT_209750 [Lichtheimia hyalospora FSU 10163]
MNRNFDTAPALLDNVHANQHIAQYDPQHDLYRLQQLFNSGKSALAADQLHDAHDAFNELQDHIETNLVSACLALRAYICQRQGNYQEGLNIADEYISKKSQEVDGYLLSANMHLLSNHRQAALDVCQRGLQHCDKQYPRYNDLLTLKNRLEEDIKRQNMHMIRTLPTEVIHTILSYLTRGQLIELAYTCTAWYSLVMDWPALWHEISIGTYDLVHQYDACIRFLGRAPAQYVRKLEYFGSESPNHSTQVVYDLIASYNWNCIEELVFGRTDVEVHMFYSPMAIIRNCKNTLKRLSLEFERGQVLNGCLEECPNLECLTYEDYQESDEDFDALEEERDPLPPGPFPLRQLIIRCEDTNLDIVELIKRCPLLESFHLLYEDRHIEDQFPSIIEMLYEHCPYLRTLEISTEVSAREIPWISAKRQHGMGNHLLRELKFNSNPTHVIDKLRTIIDKSKASLGKLDVQMNHRGGMLYQALISSQTSNLRELWCAPVGDQEVLTQLETLIKLSPRLNKVVVPAGAMSDMVLSALGQLSNLTELQFRVDQQVTYKGLTSLFSQTSSLQYVIIEYGEQHPHLLLFEVIQALAACRPLRKLRFTSSAWLQLTHTPIGSLMHEIQSHQSSLEELTVKSFGGLEEPFLLPWSGFKQLRQLEIDCRYQSNVRWPHVQEVLDQQLNIPNLRIRWDQSIGCRTYTLNAEGRCSDR